MLRVSKRCLFVTGFALDSCCRKFSAKIDPSTAPYLSCLRSEKLTHFMKENKYEVSKEFSIIHSHLCCHLFLLYVAGTVSVAQWGSAMSSYRQRPRPKGNLCCTDHDLELSKVAYMWPFGMLR